MHINTPLKYKLERGEERRLEQSMGTQIRPSIRVFSIVDSCGGDVHR